MVVLDGINKIYENGFDAIHDLSIEIAHKEFLVLVGPSGCGKSTALRMVAGLESNTSGEMRIGDRVVNDIEPKDRDIAMVFQNYADPFFLAFYGLFVIGLTRFLRQPMTRSERVRLGLDLSVVFLSCASVIW